MDGMLSQDEINALLQGMDLSDTTDSGASPVMRQQIRHRRTVRLKIIIMRMKLRRTQHRLSVTERN